MTSENRGYTETTWSIHTALSGRTKEKDSASLQKEGEIPSSEYKVVSYNTVFILFKETEHISRYN